MKINEALVQKIEVSNKKYEEIVKKIEEKKKNNKEEILYKKIQILEGEIKQKVNATQKLKKEITNIKNKIEFNSDVEKALLLRNKLKEENIKNFELQNQYKVLSVLSNRQKAYLHNNSQRNKYTEQIKYLKSEIKISKDKFKTDYDKFNIREKFLKYIHEKIFWIENIIKQSKEQKEDIKKKSFTLEDLQNSLNQIKDLSVKIKENRIILKNNTNTHDEKLHKLLTENKQIENNYKENERTNKNLIYKKNDLKRNIVKLKHKLKNNGSSESITIANNN